jgi:hypothetical protein
MTALAAPPAARRPVPWTRLAWVTARQHRLALAGALALLGALSMYLLIMGLQIRSAYAGVTSCRPAGSAACADAQQAPAAWPDSARGLIRRARALMADPGCPGRTATLGLPPTWVAGLHPSGRLMREPSA